MITWIHGASLKEAPNRIHTVRKTPDLIHPVNRWLPRIIGPTGGQRNNSKDQQE